MTQFTPDQNQQITVRNGGNTIASRAVLIVTGVLTGFGLFIAGYGMSTIRSVSGTSIAEVYYNAMGNGFMALGVLAFGLCLGLALKR